MYKFPLEWIWVKSSDYDDNMQHNYYKGTLFFFFKTSDSPVLEILKIHTMPALVCYLPHTGSLSFISPS